MHIKDVDLKLFAIFDAVMREANVSAAARRLNMSQPAVSSALARLRHLMGDPLFVRCGNGVRPTGRAIELSGPIRRVLREVEAAFAPPNFDPATARRTFKLAMSDHSAVAILPEFIERVARLAPGIDIRVQPKFNATVFRLLSSNEIDLAIGVIPETPARFEKVVLSTDRYLCLMRRDHPLTRVPLTLEALVSARHLVVRPVGEATSILDRMLEARNMPRRTVVTVNQLMVAPAVVARSDLVVVILGSTVQKLREVEQLDLVAIPLPLPPVDMVMVWSPEHANDQASNWLRELLVTICQKPAANSLAAE